MVKLDRYAKPEEVRAKVDEILKIAGQHGWLDRRVMPYGYGISIRDMMDYPQDFSKYTSTSFHIVKAEINGLIDIMNIWLEQEAEEKATVKMPNGIVKTIPISCVDDYIELGAVLVKEGE